MKTYAVFNNFISMFLRSSKNYASGGRVSVDDYESDFYTDDDDKNNCNESIIKTKTSVTSEKESIVEDLQVQSDISDDFWNTVGDEQSLENISFFERIGESTGGERNRRTIDQENEKGSEVIAEEDDDSNATPVGKQKPIASNILVKKSLRLCFLVL